MPRLNYLKIQQTYFLDILEKEEKVLEGFITRDLVLLKEKVNDIKEAINNFEENPIVIGCNYHTRWQANKAMRFVLKDVKGNRARLITRRTKKDFWTDIKDLIYIDSQANRIKYKQKLIKDGK